MYREYFRLYLKNYCNLSDSTVGHYTTAVNTISALLSKKLQRKIDLFLIDSVDELLSFRKALNDSDHFTTLDSRGNRMYSAGYNKYFAFMCDNTAIEQNTLKLLDTPVKALKQKIAMRTVDKRDRAIVSQAIQNASHICELNPQHMTFVSRTSNRPFVEAHHLIPMKFQAEFTYSLDCYANVVALCPLCHRLLHFGKNCDTIEPLTQLFKSRIDRLDNSGLTMQLDDFIALAGGI